MTYPKVQFKYNIIDNDAPHAICIHVGHATYIHIGKTGNQEFHLHTDKRNNLAIIYCTMLSNKWNNVCSIKFYQS